MIVCNGYKDESYIELALLAQQMGKRIFLVVEKMNELKPVSYTHLLPEGDRLRAHVYAAMGDALDRGEGKIAEEAACYEKSLEIVPNLYSCLLYTSRCV